jgi:hypothetical protein
LRVISRQVERRRFNTLVLHAAFAMCGRSLSGHTDCAGTWSVLVAIAPKHVSYPFWSHCRSLQDGNWDGGRSRILKHSLPTCFHFRRASRICIQLATPLQDRLFHAVTALHLPACQSVQALSIAMISLETESWVWYGIVIVLGQHHRPSGRPSRIDRLRSPSSICLKVASSGLGQTLSG